MGNQFYSPLDKVTLSRRIQNKKAFPFILMALNWRQKAKVQHVSVLKMRSFLFISNHPASFTLEHNNDVSALKKIHQSFKSWRSFVCTSSHSNAALQSSDWNHKRKTKCPFLCCQQIINHTHSWPKLGKDLPELQVKKSCSVMRSVSPWTEGATLLTLFVGGGFPGITTPNVLFKQLGMMPHLVPKHMTLSQKIHNEALYFNGQ